MTETSPVTPTEPVVVAPVPVPATPFASLLASVERRGRARLPRPTVEAFDVC